MTCVVGMAVDNKVIMGADSLAGLGYVVGEVTQEKIIEAETSGRNSERLLIGVTGSYRIINVLQHVMNFTEIPQGMGAEGYLTRLFIPKLRSEMHIAGIEKTEEGVATAGNGEWLLVGFRKRLFQIDSLFQVLEYKSGLAAIGSGAKFAYGALKVLKDLPGTWISPVQMIQDAIRVAGHYLPGEVGGKTIIKELQ